MRGQDDALEVQEHTIPGLLAQPTGDRKGSCVCSELLHIYQDSEDMDVDTDPSERKREEER